MKMVDLKLPKKSKKELRAQEASMPEEKYPWGLQLRFDNESLDKLDIDVGKVSVGDSLEGKFTGRVTQVSQRETEGRGAHKSLEVQLTRIGFTDKNSFEKGFDEAVNKK